jgi:hypothetical protein
MREWFCRAFHVFRVHRGVVYRVHTLLCRKYPPVTSIGWCTQGFGPSFILARPFLPSCCVPVTVIGAHTSAVAQIARPSSSGTGSLGGPSIDCPRPDTLHVLPVPRTVHQSHNILVLAAVRRLRPRYRSQASPVPGTRSLSPRPVPALLRGQQCAGKSIALWPTPHRRNGHDT